LEDSFSDCPFFSFQFAIFGSPAEVEIKLDDCEKRTQLDVKRGSTVEKQYLFFGKEPIKGTIAVKPNKKVEHMGARVELIGCIGLAKCILVFEGGAYALRFLEMEYDRGSHYVFTSTVRELAEPGELSEATQYTFDFSNVPKQHESYNGVHVRLRYVPTSS
jgi:vacuolar protein sorting-associated protein 26